MKIKSRAVGDPNVTAADRVYFQVNLPGDGCKCVYVSKNWSLGKAVDNMAGHAKLSAKRGPDKLKLFKSSDGSPVNGGKLDESVQALLEREELLSGDIPEFRYEIQT